MALTDLLLKIMGDASGASNAIDEAKRKVEGLEEQTTKSSGMMSSAVGMAVGAFGGFLSAQVALGVVKSAFDFAVQGALGMNQTLETTTLRFATLMGDSDLAAQHVRDLFQIAKKTPFETGPIIEASLKLQTFGGAALNTKDNIMLLGDASAATGAPINELGFWVGRLYSAIQGGQPFGEAAMRLQELAVLTPQARREMENLQQSGKNADEVFGAFKESLGGFTGAMERQAGTWEGVVSTFNDTINIVIADTFKPYFEAIRDLGKELNTVLDGATENLGEVKDGVAASKIVFIDFIETALGGMITGVSYAMVGWNAFQVVMRDVIQIVEGAALAFEYGALGLAKLLNIATFGKAFNEDIARIRGNIDSLIDSIYARGQAIQDDKKSQEDWIGWGEQTNQTLSMMTARVRENTGAVEIHTSAVKKNSNEQVKSAKQLREEQRLAKQAEKEAEQAEAAHERQMESNRKTTVAAADAIGKQLAPFMTRLRMGVVEATVAGQQFDQQFLTLIPDRTRELVKRLDEVKGSFFGVKSAVDSTLRGLPELLVKSFTGGGGLKGALSAASSQIGSSIGANIQTALTNKLTDFGAKSLSPLMEGMLSALPGLGGVIASLGGKLIGKLMNIGGPSKQEVEGRKIEAQFEAQFGSFNNMLGAVAKAYEATGRGAAAARADVEALMRAEKQGGDAVKAMLDKINGAFNEQQQDVADTEEAIRKYGFSIDQLGPTMQKQKLDEQAQQLMREYTLLNKAQIDSSLINEKMAGNMQQYLTTALKTGQAVPEAMKPIIDSMIKQGLLVDENGNKIEDTAQLNIKWQKDLGEVMQKVADKLESILRKIGMLPSAAQDAVNRMPDNPFSDWRIPGNDMRGAGTEPIPSFSNRPLEAVTRQGLALLHPGDVVGVPQGGQLGGRTVINVYGNVWSERELTEVLTNNMSQMQRDRYQQRVG